MRLLVFVALLAICYAETLDKDAAAMKFEEILPAVMSIAAGAPDDWTPVDRKAFDLFVRNIVRNKLVMIPGEMAKLKRRSPKVHGVLKPLIDYFIQGYAKLKNKEARKYFVDEIAPATSEGLSVSQMASVGYHFYKMSSEARDAVYKAFPEIF
ncbi:hypothetical protein PMAYCL1PPCAC_10447, partial [Pristionchus mayeri]